MKRRNLVLGVFLIIQFLCGLLNAQNAEWKTIDTNAFLKEYHKVLSFYDKYKSYSMQLKYSSFKDYTTNTESDRSVGFYKKDKLQYHSYIMGARTIQNAHFKFVVDEKEKVIAVWNPDTVSNSGLAIDNINLIGVKTIKQASYNGDYKYRIEYDDAVEITAVEYTISKEGLIKGIILFYNRHVLNESEKEELIKPRVVISFTGFESNYYPEEKEFDNSKFFTEKEDKLYITSAFSDYTIYDNRK